MTPRASEALSLLMEKEAQVREMETALKSREEKLSRWEKLEGMNPIQAAQELGLSLEDYQKHVLSDESYNPVARVEKQLSDQQQRLAERDAAERQAKEQATRAAAVGELKTSVLTYVEQNKNKYPLVNAVGFQDAVFDTIRIAREQGQNLSESEAASKIEARLSEVAESIRKLESATAEPEVTTLTNSNTTQSTTRKEAPKVRTREERMRSLAEVLSKTI